MTPLSALVYTPSLLLQAQSQRIWSPTRTDCGLHRCIALREASVLLHLLEDAMACTGNVPEGGEAGAEAKPAAEEPQQKAEPKAKAEPAPKKAEPAAKPAPEKKPEKKPEPPKQASPPPPVRSISGAFLPGPKASASGASSAIRRTSVVCRRAIAYLSSQQGHNCQRAIV